MKIKHIFIIILLSIGFITSAQGSVGQWKIYSSFAGIDKMVDTSDIVYYISNGQLYSYDKDSSETYNYTTGNRLSSSSITDIYYNYDKHYLTVIYSDANIDIIDANNHVYNMPDIKDAELKVVPVINNVCFDENLIYVATNFGLVVYDEKKKEVVTSGDYGRNITHVAVLGDNLWIIESWKFHVIDKNSSLLKFSGYKEHVYGQTVDEAIAFDNNNILLLTDHGKHLRMFTLIPEENKSKMVFNYDTDGVKNISRMKDGGFSAHDNMHIYTVSPKGEVAIENIKGSELESKLINGVQESHFITAYEGLDDVYKGSDTGLSKYSVQPGEITKMMDDVKSPGLTFNKIGRITKSKSGKIYVYSYGNSQLLKSFKAQTNELYHVNVIKDGKIEDLTPKEFIVEDKNNESLSKSPYGFKTGNQLVEDPYDADAYYVTHMWEGIYHFKNGKQINKFYCDNSTLEEITGNGGVRVFTMAFDKNGNMWVAQFNAPTLGGEGRMFHFLPASKLKDGMQSITESDWKVLPFKRDSHRDALLLPLQHSDVILYKDATYHTPISAIFTKGTDSPDDDTMINSTALIDQDGLTFSYNFIYDMVEDHDGKVWIATDNGVVELTRPGSIKDSNFTINHIKVPRNDGTNFADYLLSGESVYSIAVDHSNRKWIATEMSGVYLVSPTGDKILAHYDITNSPLPTNEVVAVECGTENDVYFGTIYGLAEYRSESSPASEDYSEVYAYPNPVRPEYTGLITITGLMENSHVKIADAAGNVFYQTMSEGGMTTWDGCDRSGKRVPTGVYYVFASHGSEGESTMGTVTKILVVN